MYKACFIAESDDWIALYANGVKVAEGHSITAEDALRAVGFEVETRWLEYEEVEAMNCEFPELVSDLIPVEVSG